MLVSGRVSRAIALAIAFLMLVALVVIAEIGQSGQRQINRIINLSQQRQVLLAELLTELSDAEAGQRGFLLTNDDRYLQPYQAARDRVEPTLNQITDLFRDNDRLLVSVDQRDAVRHLRVLVGAKLGELAASLALHSSQGPEQALALVRTDLGSRTMGEIRDAVSRLRDMEHNSISVALARAARLQLVSRALMGGVVLLNIALLILAAALWARQARRRAELTERLATENEELERRVRCRTAELSALSSHLQRLSEKEKAALARELHDELGGLLIAAKMDVSWLQRHLPDANPDIQSRWARVNKALDDGVGFKRRTVENLHPTLLDNIGLVPALRWITQETCTRAGLHYTEVYPDFDLRPIDDAAIMVFRLVQESLINVVKHARATQVHVEVAVQGNELMILIDDNGAGIDTDRREAPGSQGLATMRHRASSFGGTYEIESPPQGGTRVRARLPLASIVEDSGPHAVDAAVSAR
ncbi:MAG TPA: CHASE3 domain-containing protein [Steroidobacteraceae bacterium]|jgi:signal transduction histidine kinase|nr:CHASE3 domain-containing protein [Steroidobacteraceae bacterium]